jgi:tetratricopeptide (TPR) repeat protein/2-polyprenyl-3-methyl-5-hydroxy-6-metoxy-1,4-benzoquinol methylase
MNRKQEQAHGRSGAVPAQDAMLNTPSADSLAKLFGAAVAQHQAGALVEAEQRYRYILALYPQHTDSLHNLGLIALQAGDAASAVNLIGKAIAINDRIAEYHYNIAGAWRALKRSDNVATHLERAIALRGDHALAHLNLGNIRKEQGRPADAIACYERALKCGPHLAIAHFNLANVLSEQGRPDAAIANYRQALAIDPNHAGTHNNFGTMLFNEGKVDDAIIHFERALALDPNLAGTYELLCSAYLRMGNVASAIDTAVRALALGETAQTRVLFAQCIKHGVFTKENDQLRGLLQRAMAEDWSSPRDLANVSNSLIKVGAAVKESIARVNAVWPARVSTTERFGASGLAALAKDELLCRLLESDPVTDVDLERLVTNVRYLALASAIDAAGDGDLLDFYCSVARQCFINEYVFALSEAETEQAQRLRTLLEATLAQGESCPATWPAIVGAYFPLNTLSNSRALLERAWPQCVDALIIQQIKEPELESRIATTLPALTGIDGEVSRAVRQQYEENPYPRWVKAGPPTQPAVLSERSSKEALDVLIAGCGTGRWTTEFARHALRARILAIDLSLASLAYAKRMAQSFDLTNIEFAQADITKLDSFGRQFDFIDTSGVLHHLADPWEGWRTLLSLLRPGGVMQVGLYSEAARRNIVAARALIAERGYRPTPQDIRRCRHDIITAEDPSLHSITQWGDFFSISECRDLLFHVQEHRITLPQIKSFLAANNLEFAGFALDAAVQYRFATRFPERSALTDLDRWHVFETEAPNTFTGMYMFWVRMPAARP